ncbi:MAG TPA: hypothetical protein VM389_05510 [Phycisphaerae bacterium]|nr:hypothetical protein [Phycisphaerae bacterium]HUU59198.1 hypothetical protein [Phycisphaerae bacterium]
MKNDSGRPRKVRHVGPGGKAPRCGICTWGRKSNKRKRERQRVRREIQRALAA